MKNKIWTFITSKNTFKNKFISIRGDTFKTPDGKDLEFYILEGSPVVANLLVNERNEILFVKQFRPQVKKDVIGIPGGGVDENETIEQAAKRELLEETGYSSYNIEKLHEFFIDPGRSDRKFYIFFSKSPFKVSNKIDSEIERYLWIDIDTAIKKIINNEIEDPISQIAIFIAKCKGLI